MWIEDTERKPQEMVLRSGGEQTVTADVALYKGPTATAVSVSGIDSEESELQVDIP